MVSGSPRICSGDAYSGVSARPDSSVSSVSFACPSSSSLAIPKSSSRTWPSTVTRIFAGFRSRCTTSLRVRVGDGIGDLREQLQPRLQIAAAARGSTRRSAALDVLDGEIRLAVRREARVVQACDIRMRERGEDLPLARHSLREPGALPGAVRKLQRDRPIDEPVAALRQPHGAHAAAAQLAHQAIGPDGVARLLAVGGGVDDIPRASITVELRECVEEVAVPGMPGAREQITQARFESCVLRRQPFHPLLTMRRRLIERGIQQLIQLSPGYWRRSRASA